MIHGPVPTTEPQKESRDVSPEVLQDTRLTPHGLESQRVNPQRGEGSSPWESCCRLGVPLLESSGDLADSSTEGTGTWRILKKELQSVGSVSVMKKQKESSFFPKW